MCQFRSAPISSSKKSARRRFWHRPLPAGLSFTGDAHSTSTVRFLADNTWVDDESVRHSEQQIFDAAFSIIERSRKFLLLDMFLYNDFQGKEQETTRLLSGELTDLLVAHKTHYPQVTMIVITDPINVVYGSLPFPGWNDPPQRQTPESREASGRSIW